MHAPEITVERVIRGRILSCDPALSVADAAKRMTAGHCSCIVVMERGAVAGIWTERDALDVDLTRPEALAVPIGTVMHGPVKTIAGSATLGDATIRFKKEGVRHLVVTGAGGAAVGIITQTDVILNRSIQHYLSLRSVAHARSRDLTVVSPATGIAEAARLMRQRGIDAVVVRFDDGEHGIVTERDIVRHLARRAGDAPVGTLASRPLLCVDTERSLYGAKSLLAEKRIRHLGVVDGSGALVGLLSFTDILAAIEHGYAEELAAILRERNAALALSREREELVGKVFEATLEPILITDADGLIVSVNPAFTRLTGWKADEIVGRSTRILHSGRHDRAFYDAMWRELRTSGLWRGEMWDRKKSGEVFLSSTTITGIRNAEGRFTNYAAVYGNIASADQQAGRMLHRWTHDALTGLPNRCQLIETLGNAVRRARACGQVPAVAIIGLDRFRVLNDTFGLTVGDEILRVAAHRIRECVPASGTVARLVGDEFAVFLPDAADTRALQALAAAILEALSRPADVDGQEIYLTASMGIALQPGEADAPADSDAILKAAGCALHEAKQAGRNAVHLSTGRLERNTRRAFTIETDLHHALERDELRLHYQPKVDLESMRVTGMEALVRWQHPTRGLVPPDEFIAVAEECGLIVPIGNWVLETACTQTRAWVDQGLGDLQVAVNISAWQFRSDLFERQVQRALERTGLPARHLELELTESIALDDTGRSIRTMQALRDMGLDLAIDDFGTGYSSLSYVQRLPVSTVKIDRSFIRELDRQASGSAIPRAIITMAHHLGLRVVAEGIETYTHLDMLLFDGCDQGQGYYFSKPLPAADFAAFCRSPRPAERAHCQ